MRKYTKIQFWLFILILGGGLIIISCNDDDDDRPDPSLFPAVDFSASATSVQAGNEVTFTDLSTNDPFLWTWNFQGANPTYSNEKNPVVVYEAQGTFSVTMKARNEFGANEITKTDYIEVTAPPIPYLSFYAFSGNLDDSGLNGITAVSNFGDPTYTEDRNGNSASAWLAPQVQEQNLTVPGFKGIGGNNPRSVVAWFKTPEGGSRKTIVAWGENSSGKMFNVMVHTDRIRIEAGASNVRSLKDGLDDDAWHHVAVTFDPADGDKLADVKIYIDGVRDPGTPDGSGNSFNSETTVIDTDISNNDVRLGDAIYNANYFFLGALDDIRIIDRVLSEGEIQAIYLE